MGGCRKASVLTDMLCAFVISESSPALCGGRVDSAGLGRYKCPVVSVIVPRVGLAGYNCDAAEVHHRIQFFSHVGAMKPDDRVGASNVFDADLEGFAKLVRAVPTVVRNFFAGRAEGRALNESLLQRLSMDGAKAQAEKTGQHSRYSVTHACKRITSELTGAHERWPPNGGRTHLCVRVERPVRRCHGYLALEVAAGWVP